jgi:hypothetical protein
VLGFVLNAAPLEMADAAPRDEMIHHALHGLIMLLF